MLPNILLPENMMPTELPSKTWHIDGNKLVMRKMIDGIDAVVQSAYTAVETQRYKHSIFSGQYGSELKTLIGKEKEYVFSEAKRMIEDALSVDTRITAVRDFQMEDETITFVVDTIFGSQMLQIGVMPR